MCHIELHLKLQLFHRRDMRGSLQLQRLGHLGTFQWQVSWSLQGLIFALSGDDVIVDDFAQMSRLCLSASEIKRRLHSCDAMWLGCRRRRGLAFVGGRAARPRLRRQ
jgi:hypothetical protein